MWIDHLSGHVRGGGLGSFFFETAEQKEQCKDFFYEEGDVLKEKIFIVESKRMPMHSFLIVASKKSTLHSSLLTVESKRWIMELFHF